jgi:transcriptional regulator with XRE-family HTH domain
VKFVHFVTWQTDPLLFDTQPTKKNNWLTANELLVRSTQEKFFSQTNQLLLYPIMIRKIDFITGERIIQSFPYLLLDTKWVTIIRKQTLKLAEKAHYYFQESNYNISIRTWQKRIIRYLEEQQRLPFPLFRLVPSWEEFFQEKHFVRFQSARGEDFQLPLHLTEELAYLVGVVMGDGHLAEYFVNIIDSSKEHIENLAKLLEGIFKSNIELFEQQNANAWNVNILGKWIVRLFNFLSGQPINERKYPALREPLIIQQNVVYRAAFWRGLMDADGGYKNTIGFGTASERLLQDFIDFLKKHNINYRRYQKSYPNTEAFIINIRGQSRKEFAQFIGTNHPEKKKDLSALLEKKIYRFSPKRSTFHKQGFWKGQILSVNARKLQGNFFNFSLLEQLSINNMGTYFRELRKRHFFSQKELAKTLAITTNMLSNYELNKTSIPLPIIIQLLAVFKIKKVDFYQSRPKIRLTVSNSHCVVDTQPSKILLDILQGLQVKERGYFHIIKHPNYDLKEYTERLANYFDIKKPKSDIFYNAVLTIYVREFFVLRK